MFLGQLPGICSPGDGFSRGCRSPGQQPAVRPRQLMPLCRGGELSQNSLQTCQFYGVVSSVLLKDLFHTASACRCSQSPYKMLPQAWCFWLALGNIPLVTLLVFLPFSSFLCIFAGPGFKLFISTKYLP